MQQKQNIPSERLFTVQTALGLPGSSDTAISVTSNPCLKTLIVDLGPLPQSMYTCGVSSLAVSNTFKMNQCSKLHLVLTQLTQISNRTCHDWRQRVHFIN